MNTPPWVTPLTAPFNLHYWNEQLKAKIVHRWNDFSCINTLVFGPLNDTIMSRTLGHNTLLLPQYPPHPQQYTLTWLACNLESSHPGLWLHWFLYAWKAVLVCNNAYLCYVPELCVGGGSRMSVAETYLSGGWKLFMEFNKDIWVG